METLYVSAQKEGKQGIYTVYDKNAIHKHKETMGRLSLKYFWTSGYGGVWTTTTIARNSITERIKEAGFVIQEVSKRSGQWIPVACAMTSAVMYIQGAS